MSFYSPLFWTVASLLIFAIATNVDWFLRASPPSGEDDPWRDARVRLADPGLRALLFGAYMAGIPMLALLLRVPTPSQIGLPAPPPNPVSPTQFSAWRWPSASDAYRLGDVWILLLCALACLLLLLANRLWLDASLGRLHGLLPRKVSRETLVALLYHALLFEAHWALFRAGTLSVGLSNRSLGLFLALGFLALEAWSSPSNRRSFDELTASDKASTYALLALLSSSVFYFTGNSLACLAAHLIVALGLASLIDERGPEGTWAAGSRSARPDPSKPERSAPRRLTSPGDAEAIDPTIV